MAAESEPDRPRSAVLVHDMWSGPYDWRWVTRLLERAGVQVVAVDLPSHSSTEAGVREDGVVVRAAIRGCEPPVVVAAWSSGGDSMDIGAEGEAGVARLVYVASYPSSPQEEDPESLDWIDDDPLVRRLSDETFVLDTDLWLAAESHLFDSAVLAHLKAHPRRPVSLRAATEGSPGRAWTTIPFTVLLGGSDLLIPAEETARQITGMATDELRGPLDIRIIDSDHFMPFRVPELVADVILEPLP